MILAQQPIQPNTIIARSEATKQSRGFTHETGLPRRSDDLLAMTNGDSEDRLGGALFYANELLTHRLRKKDGRSSVERRKQHAANINQRQPWLKSTGPKTVLGKKFSSQNALKHGFRSRDYQEICQLLKLQRESVRTIAQMTAENMRELRVIRAKKRLMTSISQKKTQIQDLFRQNGQEVSLKEVKELIKAATGYTEEDFILRPEMLLNADQISAIDAMVARRAKGEPLYRILGVREFWGLEFKVTPDTLDPRPDTETLVEAALKFARQHPKDTNTVIASEARQSRKPFFIIDLGTGTGCVPISLLTELPHAIAVGVDYSHAAAMVARENADNLGVGDRFFVIQGDWMEALKPESFDLIVSNPPYIEESIIENLSVEVKNHDPFLALSGGRDGLDCYKKIISALKIHLKGQNKAFLEIGIGQLESVAGLVDDSNLLLCDSYADIAGIPRVVEISNGDK